jgi:quercetin dioxygenase-like cupin family protein
MTRRITLDNLSPLDTKGIRCQTVHHNGCQIRLVEFAPGFHEIDWCQKAHIGYVLAGQLEIEFIDAVERFSAGDALMISANDTHRARVVEGPVRLFLVEELNELSLSPVAD